jgi:hypothetical protein
MERAMNKDHILTHLKEAKTEIDRMTSEVEKDSDFDFDGYYVNLQHIYSHLNTAWNSRKQNKEKVQAASQDDLDKWRRFSSDVDMK